MQKTRHQRRANSEGRLLSPGATHAVAREKNVGFVPKVACYLSFFMFGLSACAFVTLHFHQAAEDAQLQRQRMPRLNTAPLENTQPVEKSLPEPVENSLPQEPQMSEQSDHESQEAPENVPADAKPEPAQPEAAKHDESQEVPKESANRQDALPEAAKQDALPEAAKQESGASPVTNPVRTLRSPRKSKSRVEYVLDPKFAGYALIPRPVFIESLTSVDASTNGDIDVSNDAIIRIDVGSRRVDDKFEAMFAAYQNLLGLHVQRVDLTKENNLVPGSVAIVVRDTVEAACAACVQLLGRSAEDENMKPREDVREAEWHFAVFVDRRLVVCVVDPEGAFRFAATLRQMLYAIPRSTAAIPRRLADTSQELSSVDTSQTASTSMIPETPGSLRANVSLAPASSNKTIDSSSSIGDPPSPKGGYQRLLELEPFVLQDWPHYEWRGLQLDCVRHFMPLPFLKRYLSAMAYYKANVFHWHLTDDQAWRVFIPSRPKLVNASATPGYYTTADVRTIVAFAASLFIKVIPVIETPGHSLVALAAYPELACEGKDFKAPLSRVGTYDDILCVAKRDTEKFARDVFTEIAKLFPFQFVHIGGDEIPTLKWQRSKHVKAFAGLLGLNNLQADVLEAWYCFLAALLKERNRTIVMWDDHFVNRKWGVTKLCPGAEEDWVVQAWKMDPPVGDFEKESIVKSFPFRSISSSMKRCYLDYPVASIDFNKTLSWRPGEGNVMGGCANMWTEDSEPEEVGEKVYPRYLGLTDRMWDGIGPGHGRDLDLQMYAAAQMHCNEDGPLRKEFNFTCGRFEIISAGRSEFWKNTRFYSSVDAFDKSFVFDRALDEDPDTYFWGISPKRFDTMDVYWLREDHSHGPVVGKCLSHVTVATGSKDRPGDQLDNGELLAAQWLRSGGDAAWKLEWSKLAEFTQGKAEADRRLLARGPIVGLRIKVTVEQTKWITIPEIDVVECEVSSNLPRIEDLPDTSAQSFFGSGGWDRGSDMGSFHPMRTPFRQNHGSKKPRSLGKSHMKGPFHGGQHHAAPAKSQAR